MATNINRGKQQITIYPYQEVTSINANQILYGVLQPGVSNIKLEVYTPTSNELIGIKIYAGATFIFEQEATESGVTRKFLVKCVLEDDVMFENFTKVSLWTTLSAANALYVYANLNYDLANSGYRYADFSITADKAGITTDKDLIVATLLNHQYFVKAYALSPSLAYDLNHYYVSYQEQRNSNIFPSLYEERTRFTPVINGEMRSVTIEGGNFLAGNSLGSVATTTLNIPDKVSSSLYPAGKVAADLYQIDTLRLKIDKGATRASGFIWESTLLDKPSTGDWTWTASYTWTEDKLLDYLKDKPLDIQDDGEILLILVRPCDAVVITDFVNSYSTWATSAFNKITPSTCYIPRRGMLKLRDQDHHSRFKLPSYPTSELTN